MINILASAQTTSDKAWLAEFGPTLGMSPVPDEIRQRFNHKCGCFATGLDARAVRLRLMARGIAAEIEAELTEPRIYRGNGLETYFWPDDASPEAWAREMERR